MNIDELIAEIEKFTVIELNEFTKAIQAKWDIDPSAMMPAMVVAGGAAAGGEAAAAEQTEFDLILTSSGEAKIQVIKAIREITSLGLKEAKALVDEIPNTVKEKISKEEAEDLKKKIEAAGGTAEIK
ncbi:50S ribosomal protein L7/L12 [bacterium]|nr:50S ribosomal protein L7/L12 [bacterium]MBU1025665.1 50S ribosomal protein L7/L12 [bacterium]